MASESTDGALTVTLPADLDDWLDDRAAQLDVDRETVLVQLLASYRAAAELDGDLDGADVGFPVADGETVAETVEAEVGAQLQDALESGVADRISAETETLRRQFDERLDALETDYADKLDDVRERVVQVKKETDGKAPRDHGHPELDRVGTLEESVGSLADRVGTLEASVEDLDSTVADHDVAIEETGERVENVQERLQTVAWVVSDLKDEGNEREAVEQIKRAAARADVDRAKCEHCGNGVDIALLTDPECPHCQATVTDVQPAQGFFSKPTLLAASQLESGEDR